MIEYGKRSGRMEYLKINDVAKDLGLGVRRVQLLCSAGKYSQLFYKTH